MSHPEHELTPKEHQLSQEVVEFLIAHQDWFMLDIPPPPASPSPHPHHPGGVAREDVEDVVMVSSSEDEGSPATTGTGGWKLVGGRTQAEQGRRVARRRTMNERDKLRGGAGPFVLFLISIYMNARVD